MDDPWKKLQSAAIESLDPLWNDFAKEGREGAILAPLAQYPKAAAWLARSMGMSSDCITRKLAAMLAGWIQDPKQVSTLLDMLEHERVLFRKDGLNANSVGEDIMFAATRWTGSQDAQVRDAGVDLLARMINDALTGTHWNTVHWAVANLNHATNGNHPIFVQLNTVTEEHLVGQRFFLNAVKALQQRDVATLNRLITLPSAELSLSPNDPNYTTAVSLWNAAALAEAAALPNR